MAQPERPGAQEWVPARSSLKGIRESLPDCRGCQLYEDATQAVMGVGRADARLVVLGEQPGDREDQEGRPFVGPAGSVLDDALEDAGIDHDEVYLTNVVKHFRHKPGPGKRRIHERPSREHVAACGPWLAAEFATLDPDGVVLLGAKFRVGEVRGYAGLVADLRVASEALD